jgi:hypothetical protein
LHAWTAASFFGTNAYGYGAGRPVLNVDATGRKIDREQSGEDSLAVLSTVEDALPAQLRDIDADQHVNVVIRRDGEMAPNGASVKVPVVWQDWMRAVQNGGCLPPPNDGDQCRLDVEIYWASEKAKVRPGHKFGKASALIAHELGHVYAAVQCLSKGRVDAPSFVHDSTPYEPSGISWAVGFENALAGRPYMWPHEHGGYEGHR